MNFFRARINRFAPCLAATLVCLLVWMQISGLHFHVQDGGHAHVHAAHAPGHHHAAHHDAAAEEIDLSLISLIKQILAFPLALIFMFLLFRVSVGGRLPPPADIRVSRRPWFHFIPPLRGPPLTA